MRLRNGKLKRAQGKNLYTGITVHTHGDQHDDNAVAKRLRKSNQMLEIGDER